ncbi:hypothetical protein NEOLEDRAFT_1158700 [Neolentinus lepideus HHB14362 ss-1]|uniref:Uncharacterized protein n=1 Tax=Neolentinus lepideus HHB14362 ss-1 TaxID=1314782 RepID=A0A165P1G7_9AGAM|nr:hypothetical protein NEOLEDRAFT_1158700 [Neolentinus lepideus HHB14362 ss-1]
MGSLWPVAGLGLALAILLRRKGIDVSIIAHDEKRLQKVLALTEAERQTPNQLSKSHSYSFPDAEGANDALEAACQSRGRVCLIAWTALLGIWYNKIVFVSSVLGYMSIIGYSFCSPGKFARSNSLAGMLRLEMPLYPVGNESRTKPKVTLKLEQAAELDGAQHDYFHISADIIIFRTASRGPIPLSNTLIDWIYTVIEWVIPMIRSIYLDLILFCHCCACSQYIAQTGHYSNRRGHDCNVCNISLH